MTLLGAELRQYWQVIVCYAGDIRVDSRRRQMDCANFLSVAAFEVSFVDSLWRQL
jgi:hypothetical protein